MSDAPEVSPLTPPAPQRLDRRDLLIMLGLFVGTLALLMSTMGAGLTRDESFYFHAAYEYIGWFEELADHWRAGRLGEAFGRASVDRHWGYNPEHPALMKTLFALSYKLFHQKLQWLPLIESMRLPGAAMGAWLCAMVYGFGRQVFGRLAGIVAVGALLCQPRFFFHAHQTCFDVPMAAMWFAVIYAYWRSLGSVRWAWGAGVLWGLALATKLNAFFLPVILVAHWLLVHGRQAGVVRGESGDVRVRVPPMPWGLVLMAVLGPIIFYLHWPRIWFDTFERVSWYMRFHLKHEHYFVYYFGQNLARPPFPISFPFVMTAVTVPLSVLGAGALGAVAAARERHVVARLKAWVAALRARRFAGAPLDPRGTGLLLAINLLFPLALIAQPSTPVFGGTKHWMPAMPYLSMLAGAGVAFALAQAQAWWQDARAQAMPRAAQALVGAALAAAIVGPAALETAHNHPFGTSYYNEVIGGTRGAADRHMMRQFWGYASRQSLAWLNANAPKNATVYTHNMTGWAWQDYRKQGLIRKDLRPAPLERADIALYHHQKAFHYIRHELWDFMQTRAPVHLVTLDGVPLVSVYARRGVKLKQTPAAQAPPTR